MRTNLFLLLVLVALNPVQARKIKRIPSPSITKISETMISPATQVKIYGQGFIRGMPNAHKVILSKGKIKLRAKVIKANGDMLQLQVPEVIELGDYQLSVKIRTRLLRSRASKASERLLLRPPAPSKPQLNYQTLEHADQITELIEKEAGIYYQEPEELSIGNNEIKAFYFQDGYQSLLSKASNFFYLPELAVKSQLKLESEAPVKSYAVSQFLNARYDVSEATQEEQEELARHYYLSTPSSERYLEHSIELSPVYIAELHVTEPEYAILNNRSSKEFKLTDCILSDAVRKRYQFDKQILNAKSKFKLEANLGLNNSSPDHLELSCQEQSIDRFSYEKVDSGGFGVKLR
ncbi:MAG: hypothetical protein OXU45_02535 [Candidatus Melainabacteria bacterium]|nr:hypothetical protein [Candidatus Melainabacteria bacterium]